MGFMNWLRPKVIKISIVLVLLSSLKGYSMSNDTRNVVEFFKKKYSNYQVINQNSPEYTKFKDAATGLVGQLLLEAKKELGAGDYAAAIASYNVAIEIAEMMGSSEISGLKVERAAVQKACLDRISKMMQEADTFIQALQYNGAFQVLQKALDLARGAGLSSAANDIESFMDELAGKFNDDKKNNDATQSLSNAVGNEIDAKGWNSARLQARLFLHLEECYKKNTPKAFVFNVNGEDKVIFTQLEIQSLLHKVQKGKIKKFAIDKLQLLAQVELKEKIARGVL